jgi:two-component system cell cycle response regulator PopA
MLASVKRTDDSYGTPKCRQRKTCVLIVSDHPVESRDVAVNLRALGLDIQLALFDGQSLTALPTRFPDAVLCHLVDYADEAPKVAKVIRSHFKSHHFPLIGAMSRPPSVRLKDFDSTLLAPVHPSQIANRVNAMIRLGIMEGEITRRLETLRESFGQTVSIGDMNPERKFRVLFIGKAAPSFMVIINALQDKGVDVTAAFTSFSAFDYLHDEPFDAVIMNTLEQVEPGFSIAEAMRRNSRLYHTPTLFLVKGDRFKDFDGAYERGARDIIDCDADSDEISGRILELANYHRIHEQIKSDFKTITLKHAGDEFGTVFSQKFMRAHFPRILRDACKYNRPVSLIGLRLHASSTDSVSKQSITSAFDQTADLLHNLVRMQDVVCRWDEDKFVLSFFDTNAAEAQIVLDRIKSLMDCSVYDSGHPNGSPLVVSAQTIISEVLPTHTADHSHLDALIRNLIIDPDEA